MDQEPPEAQAGNSQETSSQPPEASPSPISETAQDQPISHTAAGNRRDDHEINWPAWIQAVSAIIIVIVTSVYAYYAARQWQTLQDQLTTVQTIEGAHLGVGRFEINLSEGLVRIPIENYGHMPSPHATIYVHVYKMNSGEQTPFYTRSHPFGGDRTPIPPGTGKYGVTVPVEFVPGEIEKIHARQAQLVIFVVIRYDNGFGKISQPGFCFSYTPMRPGSWDACGPVVTFEDLQKMTPEK